MADDYSNNSALAAMVPYETVQPTNVSQLAAMAVYAPNQVRHVRDSLIAAMVPYAVEKHPLRPFASEIVAMVTWSDATGAETRTRSWTFDLDGHTFYVLDLGQEGTFLYDMTTQQWCQFQTTGYQQWNFHHGTMWGEAGRIVAGDGDYPYALEMVPDATMDDGFRSITHKVTGGLATRSRVALSVESVRMSGSIGGLDEDVEATFTMRFSDDNGNTWSSDYTVELIQGDYDQNVEWTSLGSFMMPGRIFEFEDVGGLLRIDGVDVGIEDFDEDNIGG